MFFKKFFKNKTKIDKKDNPKIHRNLQKNISFIKNSFNHCDDLLVREFSIKSPYNIQAAIIGMDGLIDKQTVNLEIMKPLMHGENYPQYDIRPVVDIISEFALSVGEVTKGRAIDDLINAILSGDCILLLEDSSDYLIINTRGWEKRGVENPDSESIIRGPKEGFTESLRVNTALIRRRLKTPDLKIEQRKVGVRTKTDLALIYVSGLAKEELIEEVKKRLGTINIDGIIDTGMVEEFIEDNPYSPFPQTIITERPDKVAAALLDGRIAIVLDGTPMVLIVPAVFLQFYQSPEDYYERSIFGSGVRLFRLFGFIMATSFPAIYVALVSFHHGLIPSKLVLSISKAREGVPFPAVIEAFIMEIALDLLREASIRLPTNIGQTIGIVGALVLGQAAIQARIVSPIMIIVVALTGIGSFVVPNFSTSYSTRFLRYPILIAAGTLGAYGISLTWCVIVAHLCTLESFGVPYLSPVSPFKTSALKDSILRLPLWWMRTRSGVPEAEDNKRIGKKKGGNKNGK
jgi:hypothetical protein